MGRCKKRQVHKFTVEDFCQDAAAALPLLRKRFNKVGVLGHSEGGTIAMILAAEDKTDFIVSLAGMAISGKETIVMQNRQIMSSLNMPKETTETFCKTLSKVFDEIANGKKANEISTDGVPETLKPVLIKRCNRPTIHTYATSLT